MDEQRIKELFRKYQEGTCSAEERKEVEQFYNAITKPRKEVLEEDQLGRAAEESWGRFQQHIHATNNKRNKIFAYAAAAAVVIIFAIGYQFIDHRQPTIKTNDTVKTIKDVAPGGNYATLTLPNGQRINLSEAPTGNIPNQSKTSIYKTNEREAVFTGSNHSDINTVETPKGGQFTIGLPDGTKVWLNAASSLKFPANFNGNERMVTLTGEAYFEVAKNAKQPFIVVTSTQKVQVLGTKFYVNSYPDEQAVRTTLREGSVRVFSTQPKGDSSEILKPGQMALHQGNNFKIQPLDEDAIAWKEQGKMIFRDSDLPSIMRQVSRWYNLSVRFEGPISTERFTAGISRGSNLSALLHILEGMGIRFTIESQATGNVLIVKN